VVWLRVAIGVFGLLALVALPAHADVEDQARRDKRGLWKGEVVPPCEWRKRGK